MVNSLYTELKRRNVFRVGAAYLAGSWLFVEVAGTLLTVFNYDDSAMRLLVIILAIGFIPVLIFSWVYELTTDGFVKESEVVLNNLSSINLNQKLDYLIIGLLVIGMGYFIWESRFEDVESSQTERTSIAVLAFDDMSPDKDQEYFSDGISEEILNVLAKIPRLHVTSRSSAFSFKGNKIITSEVASKLGVKNILEGSVRKAGNRIRITAQLIEAPSDKHLWSETYDRELNVDNIFDIQDEISAAIVQALKIKLKLDTKVASTKIMVVNLDAHNEYLQGRFFIEKRTRATIEKALAHFNKSIELAPEYAPAWMGKAWATIFLKGRTTSGEMTYERALTAIKKSLLLDPELPEAHAIMGLIVSNKNKEKAIAHYERAIELNPNYADVYSWLSISTQDPKKQLALLKRAVKLNPMSLVVNYNYSTLLISFGRFEETETVAAHMMSIEASHRFPYIIYGNLRHTQGKIGEAAFYYDKLNKLFPNLLGNRGYAAEFMFFTIGLGEQAAALIEGTDFDIFKYKFRGNQELFLTELRANFPSSNKDSHGNYVRAFHEYVDGNYQEATKYWQLTTFHKTHEVRIFSYLQTGKTEDALSLLKKRKEQYINKVNAGISFFNSFPIEREGFIIANLEGDIDKSIVLLQKAIQKGLIMKPYDMHTRLYDKIRAHPKWPDLFAESEKRAKVQREIYLKLVAEQTKISQ